ncbi:MAG: hypothetical protein IVW54_21585 [Candidatus Binataceae bacterium]|nr:hypothetical protein [Candidatus Binataceae bacterium]
MMKHRRMAALVVAAALALPLGALAQNTQSNVQVPQPAQGGVDWKGAGYGAATLFSNMLYIPAKLLYAIGGGLVGGGGYLVTGGNQQVADTIWRTSLGGDYVLTPDMLQGKQPVYFSGPNTTAPTPPNARPGYGGSIAPQSQSMSNSQGMSNSNVANNGSTAYSAPADNPPPSNAAGANFGTSNPPANSNGGLDAGSGPVGSGSYRPAQSAPGGSLPGTNVE